MASKENFLERGGNQGSHTASLLERGGIGVQKESLPERYAAVWEDENSKRSTRIPYWREAQGFRGLRSSACWKQTHMHAGAEESQASKKKMPLVI